MNDDQTYNSVAFKLNFKDEARSKRSSTARGITIPDVVTVSSQDYVDAATKVAGRRHNVRVSSYELDTNGVLIEDVLATTIQIPGTATTGQITTLLATYRALIAASGILEAVINNEK